MRRKAARILDGRLAALLAAAGAAAFLPALSGGWCTLDDPQNILENPLLAGPVSALWSSLYMTTYQPLAWLAFKAIGPNPALAHAASLLLHAANAALLFLILRDALDDVPAALAGACLWAVHPMNASMVAWATKLSDLLSAHFALWACLAHLRGRFWTALGAFALSGFSRWTGFGVPFALLLLEPKPRWGDKAPFFAVAAVFAAINGLAKAQIQGIDLLHPATHPWDAAAGVFFYLRKALLPWGFAPVYAIGGGTWQWIIPALAVTSALLSRPRALGAWLFYAVSIAPTLAAADDGSLYGQDAYAYIPNMALAALAAAGLRAQADKSRGRFALAVALAVLATISVYEARNWRDQLRLWTRAVSVQPQNWLAHRHLGTVYFNAGRFSDASAHFAEAVRLHPQDEELKSALPKLQELLRAR